MTWSREVALLRLVAQRLAGPRPASSSEAVRWLTGAVDGVIAVESELHWQVDEIAAKVPASDPAPLA